MTKFFEAVKGKGKTMSEETKDDLPMDGALPPLESDKGTTKEAIKGYDHAKDKACEACGMTKEQTADLRKRCLELLKGSKSFSEFCESLEKNMSKRELAYLSAQKVMDEYEKMMMLGMLFGKLL